MISRASLALLILLAGAASVPPTFAAAADASAAARAQQAKAAQAKKARLAKQQQLKKQQLAKQQEQKKDEWYAKDRDRGLDIAAEYAPKQIAKVRKNNTIAKGDTVSTGNGNKGWRAYMDKYYSR